MYVKARLVEGIEEHAILVPQKGVSRDERGNATALVVGPGNKVQKRVIDTVRTVGDRWLVSRGLRPGDKLVVDGLMSVSPGDVVKPVALALPSKSRSEEHTSELQSLMRISYAVFCLKK